MTEQIIDKRGKLLAEDGAGRRLYQQLEHSRRGRSPGLLVYTIYNHNGGCMFRYADLGLAAFAFCIELNYAKPYGLKHPMMKTVTSRADFQHAYANWVRGCERLARQYQVEVERIRQQDETVTTWVIKVDAPNTAGAGAFGLGRR